jgi:hypothetical protein
MVGKKTNGLYIDDQAVFGDWFQMSRCWWVVLAGVGFAAWTTLLSP